MEGEEFGGENGGDGNRGERLSMGVGKGKERKKDIRVNGEEIRLKVAREVY